MYRGKGGFLIGYFVTILCARLKGQAMSRVRYFTAVMAAGMALTIPLSSAIATEVISYTYDAKDRLVKVVRAGTANNNVTVEYSHDRADNRTRVKAGNSPDPPP
jgi:hypothetical protein